MARRGPANTMKRLARGCRSEGRGEAAVAARDRGASHGRARRPRAPTETSPDTASDADAMLGNIGSPASGASVTPASSSKRSPCSGRRVPRHRHGAARGRVGPRSSRREGVGLFGSRRVCVGPGRASAAREGEREGERRGDAHRGDGLYRSFFARRRTEHGIGGFVTESARRSGRRGESHAMRRVVLGLMLIPGVLASAYMASHGGRVAVASPVESRASYRLTRMLQGDFEAPASGSDDAHVGAVTRKVCRVDAPALGEHVLYAEERFANGTGRPLSQRVYVVEAEGHRHGARVREFTLLDPEAARAASATTPRARTSPRRGERARGLRPRGHLARRPLRRRHRGHRLRERAQRRHARQARTPGARRRGHRARPRLRRPRRGRLGASHGPDALLAPRRAVTSADTPVAGRSASARCRLRRDERAHTGIHGILADLWRPRRDARRRPRWSTRRFRVMRATPPTRRPSTRTVNPASRRDRPRRSGRRELGAPSRRTSPGDRRTAFLMPWPSDLARTARGKIDLTFLPGAGTPTILGQYVTLFHDRLPGFSPVGAAYFRFGGAIDPATLPANAEASRSGESSVQLIDVDPTSPDHGRRIPLQWHFRDTPTRYWHSNTLAVAPATGFPLRPRTRYALVVTTRPPRPRRRPLHARPRPRRRARDGRFGEDAVVTAARAVFNPALDELAGVGVTRERILSVTTFTTLDPGAEFFRAADWLRTMGPTPALADLGAVFDLGYADSVIGHYGPNPVFQAGPPPYGAMGSGGFVLDAAGVPQVQRTETHPLRAHHPGGPDARGGLAPRHLRARHRRRLPDLHHGPHRRRGRRRGRRDARLRPGVSRRARHDGDLARDGLLQLSQPRGGAHQQPPGGARPHPVRALRPRPRGAHACAPTASA